MIDKRFIFLVALLVLPMVSAVTLDVGTVLNTTYSNSSITVDTIPLVVSQASVENNGVVLTNPSWSSGGLTVNVTGNLNYSTVRSNILTSTFPRITSGDQYSKTLASSWPSSITSDVSFSVNNCENLGNIKDSTGTSQQLFQRGTWSCSNNIVTLPLLVIESGSTTLDISYGCSTSTSVGFRLIMLFASLSVVLFIGFYVYRKGFELSVGEILMIAVVVIVCVILWTVAGQQLGGYCPVN